MKEGMSRKLNKTKIFLLLLLLLHSIYRWRYSKALSNWYIYLQTISLDNNRCRPRIYSYKFIFISSNIKHNTPVRLSLFHRSMRNIPTKEKTNKRFFLQNNFTKKDNIRMTIQLFQHANLSNLLDFIHTKSEEYSKEHLCTDYLLFVCLFHFLCCPKCSISNILAFQYFRKCSFAFFPKYSILLRNKL